MTAERRLRTGRREEGRRDIANEPLPHQMTAGRLRELLRCVPDETVVALELPPLPPDGWPHPRFVDVAVRPYAGGPGLVLEVAEPAVGA